MNCLITSGLQGTWSTNETSRQTCNDAAFSLWFEPRCGGARLETFMLTLTAWRILRFSHLFWAVFPCSTDLGGERMTNRMQKSWSFNDGRVLWPRSYIRSIP